MGDAILTNQGPSSTFSGVVADGPTNKTGLTENAPGNTLTLTGTTKTYTGPTTINGGTLLGGVTNAFSAASPTTINAGGFLDLGGFAQTINTVHLSGGAIQNGDLTGAIFSSGGTVSGIGGPATLSATGGTTSLLGSNTYTGATIINGGSLDVVGSLGSSATPGGPISIGPQGAMFIGPTGSINIGAGNLMNNGIVNEGTVVVGPTGSINIGATNLMNNGIVNEGTLVVGPTAAINMAAAHFVNNGIVNEGTLVVGPTGSINIGAANLMNSGVVNGQGTITLGTFVNNGVLDLTNPNTVATNFMINGKYAAEDPDIKLNVSAFAGRQANHLTITGAAAGATTVLVTPLHGALTLFSNPIPIINDGPGSTATFSAESPPSLVNYSVRQDPTNPNQFDLYSNLNTAPIGAIASGIHSAITSVTTGFFQDSTGFLTAPINANPAQIDAGVWTRGATGMNTEDLVVTSSGTSPANLKTQIHFNGFQVGSDLGVLNIQNTGWNLRGGLTGGEYSASVDEANLNAANSSYFVPFLGLYAAATGHGFFADALLRHDFWQGTVTSSLADLTSARMNGDANAVTVEAGYSRDFENGLFVTPSLGFAYTNAHFDNLTLLPGSAFAPTLNVGTVISELGHVGMTLGDTVATQYWALTPTLNASVWHEFANQSPSIFTYASPGQYITDNVAVSHIGTFGQVGIGLTAQPVLNPNWTLFVRADYDVGSDIRGANINGGFRYQF